jgi:hypothetical protein
LSRSAEYGGNQPSHQELVCFDLLASPWTEYRLEMQDDFVMTANADREVRYASCWNSQASAISDLDFGGIVFSSW